MNAAYRNLIANAGATAITHIGLVNGSGTQVGDGRRAVTWTSAADGLIRPNADLVYTMAEGDVVAGWQGYSAATGGTSYGIVPVDDPRTFGNPGTYTLQAAETSIDHQAAA